MAKKTTIIPPRAPAIRTRVESVVTDSGRKVATLACGHQISSRTAWAGKLRWCPTCSRSQAPADSV